MSCSPFLELQSRIKIYLPKILSHFKRLNFKNPLKGEENYSTNMEGANNITVGLLCEVEEGKKIGFHMFKLLFGRVRYRHNKNYCHKEIYDCKFVIIELSKSRKKSINRICQKISIPSFKRII